MIEERHIFNSLKRVPILMQEGIDANEFLRSHNFDDEAVIEACSMSAFAVMSFDGLPQTQQTHELLASMFLMGFMSVLFSQDAYNAEQQQNGGE